MCLVFWVLSIKSLKCWEVLVPASSWNQAYIWRIFLGMLSHEAAPRLIMVEAVLKLPCGSVTGTCWKWAQELLLLKEMVPFPHLFSPFAPHSTDSTQFLKLTTCINLKFFKDTFNYHVLSDLIAAHNIGISIYPEFQNYRSSAFHLPFKVLGLYLWFI